LLQERGAQTVVPETPLPCQNLAENGSMLVMIGLYTLAVRAGASIVAIAGLFGIALAVAIAALWLYRVRSRGELAVETH